MRAIVPWNSRAERLIGEQAFDRRDHQQFHGKAVIFGGQLAPKPIRENLQTGLALEPATTDLAPARALVEPREGAAADIKPEIFGDQMIVRGRTVAAQAAEIELMAIDLATRQRRIFEQVARRQATPPIGAASRQRP